MSIRISPPLSLLCAAALTLAACAGPQTPAPANAAGPKMTVQNTGMVSAAGTDTVAAIARKYKVSEVDLIRVNKLKPPYKLTAGERLKLPPPRNYTVKKGDTLASVAKLFDVTPADIARVNGVPSRYPLHAGQQLRVPQNAKPGPSVVASVESGFSTAGKSLTSVIRHFALYDDGEGAAASGASAPAAAIQKADDEELDRSATAATQAVDKATMPTPTPTLAATAPDAPGSAAMAARSTIQAESLNAPTAPAPAAPTVEAHAADAAALPDNKEATTATSVAETKTPVATTKTTAASVIANQPSGRFNWPVRGKIISGYGPKRGGLHNDGINIRAAKGAPVDAAGPGTVVYAGNGVKGYGNLVLIRHADRWMTAYAHLDSIAVEKGQAVAAGDRVGAVGSTGGVSLPQLHFEIRHGTEPLNPQAYMPKR